jgi:hypothetical protein
MTILFFKNHYIINIEVNFSKWWKKNIYNHNHYVTTPYQQSSKLRTTASKSVNIKLGGVY